MNITDVKVYKLSDQSGKCKAMAQVCIENAIVLTGLRVMEGKYGMFVTMAQRKQGEEYKDVYYPLNKDIREQLKEAVLAEYEGTGIGAEKEVESTPTHTTTQPSQPEKPASTMFDDDDDDEFPF